ncbi:hypothetical protein B0T37_02045 [Chromobacterium violaceum]|uniref:DUF2087 domain-containing protein n=1 Tax=Chromobacterium violaceum TaxID=536 RepID=UPI0009DAFBB5|nr:DUF2087 domain-containing protein [Chromobacterium violaceum]OQS10985.1 hypothetical protein B0T38_06615 [Chromobacterium violaceum]OQS30161.1 hypothetical protein B0T37_02045 [Chromobacterium violaceum]
MSRTLYPFYSSDISALARSLKQQWAEQSEAPGHLQILNMLARAAGFQNFQHLRAEHDRPAPAEPQTVSNEVRRLLRHFDDEGRLARWPKKFSEQRACLWALWAGLPRGEEWDEPAANAAIRALEALGDHVLIRRELVEGGWIGRTDDCRRYWLIERAVPEEMSELAEKVRLRRAG